MTDPKQKKRLRLVKVVIEPHFVIDDGTELREQVLKPIVVAPSEWPEYPKTLAKQITETETELNSEGH